MSKKKQNEYKKARRGNAIRQHHKKKLDWSIFQSPATRSNDKLFKKIFWIIFGLVSAVTLFMAWQTGVNEDEKFHYPYVETLLKFYTSFGEDTSYMTMKLGRMYLYGGFVDIMTGIGKSLFGFESAEEGYRLVRHTILSLIGMVAFLYTGLIGKRLAGWRAGIIALLLLFLYPRFLGHAGINPRDIPFASGYIMSLYFMVKFFGEIPKVNWKTILGLAAGLGMAFATRSGGLLLFAYFGLFGLVHLWRSAQERREGIGELFSKYLIYGCTAGIGGFVLALLFWPYGLLGPIKNVMTSLTEFSNFSVSLRMLYQGDMVWSSDVPPESYIFTWLAIATPLIMLIGIPLALIFSKGILKRTNRFYIGMIGFVLLFPIMYMIYKQSNLYTGMRHLLFLIPPIAILSALGWDYLIHRFENNNRPVVYGIAGLMGILALFPLAHIASNFKTCYVYFNELKGGVSGAVGDYELDYWGVSIKQAIGWMDKEGLFEGEDQIMIASNSSFVLGQYVDKYKNVKTRYVRFRERYEKQWDYAIFINHFIDGAHLRGGKYLDNNVIKTIGKGDSPFSIIYKSPDNPLATNAYKALKANNFPEAISLFNQEIAQNPNNENAFNGLGRAYFTSQQYAEAEPVFRQALALNPANQVAQIYTSLLLLNLNRLDESITSLNKSLELNNRDVTSKYYLGVVLSRKGNQSQAIQWLEEALRVNPGHTQSMQLLVQIYSQQGDQARASHYKQLLARYGK